MQRVVIVPTYNEAQNIGELVRRINQAVPDANIFVVDDDSPDGTALLALNLGCGVLRREGKRGLTTAVADGIALTDAEAIAVIDGDLQHPPEALSAMFDALRTNDVVVGSRYCKGGATVGWPWFRRLVSWMANVLAWPLLPSVRDRTSGFFVCRRSVLPDVRGLKHRGWKVLQDILVRGTADRVAEVAIAFDARRHGHSKFTYRQVAGYLHGLLSLYFEKFKWLRFCVVGALGAVVHFSTLYGLTDGLGLWYVLSAIVAVVVAASHNYCWHHIWTFSDRQAGRKTFGVRWGKYLATSALADGMYMGLLVLMTEWMGWWYMLSAAIAVLLSTALRWGISLVWVWRQPARDPDAADYDWRSFYRGHLIQRWWKRSMAREVWGYLPVSERLLDVGCGSSPIIAHYPGAVGIDVNGAKLAYLHGRLDGTTRLMRMSVDSLTFQDGAFSDAVCIEVLEHLHNPGRALREIARVVQPGGRVVLATPDSTKWLWRLAERFTPYKEQHEQKMNIERLEALGREAGLMLQAYRRIAGCDIVARFEKESS